MSRDNEARPQKQFCCIGLGVGLGMVESGWYGLGRVGIGVGGGCAGPDVVGPRLSSFPPTHTVGDRYKYPPS